MEPWRAALEWKTVGIGEISSSDSHSRQRSKRTTVSLESTDSVNFNITSTLVELYQMVKANWTEDYFASCQQTRDRAALVSAAAAGSSSCRTPFVPFALRNKTGSDVWFCTQTRLASSQFAAARNEPHTSSRLVSSSQVQVILHLDSRAAVT